jgi:hypothetical protein
MTYVIEEANVTGGYFKATTTVSSEFTSGDTIRVYDSTGNNGQYTASGDSEVSGNYTVIYTSEAISDDTDDGRLFNEEDVLSTDSASTDFLKVIPPDGFEIIEYFLLEQADGTEILTAYTKDHIYKWDTTLTMWLLKWSCGSSCTYWSIDQLNDYVVCTNGVDPPLRYDGGAGNFDEVDSDGNGPEVSSGLYIATAKRVKVFENFVIWGNVTLSDATVLSDYIYWSTIDQGVHTAAASADYLVAGSGNAGRMKVAGPGSQITSFGTYDTFLAIFKDKSWRKVWFTGDDDVFHSDTGNNKVGCKAPASVVGDEDDHLYFYGTDMSFREVNLGRISQGLNVTARTINPVYWSLIKGHYTNEYDEVIWSIPYGNQATANNKCVVYKDGKWNVLDIAVVAFGHWNRQANYTWDTLPWASWEDWGWDRWNTTETEAGFPIDICSDNNGTTFKLHGSHADDGTAHTRYFVLTTDLSNKAALMWNKIIHEIRCIVRNEGSGTLAIYLKADNEADWRTMGTVSLTGDEAILVQPLTTEIRGKHFLIKVVATGNFHFIGMEFDWEPDGDR